MPQPQNIVAVFFDFDMTLCPDYMQKPLFERYGSTIEHLSIGTDILDKEAKKQGVNLDSECAYLNYILRQVKEEKFPGLSNKILKELGSQVELFPGLPDFLPRLKENVEKDPKYAPKEVKVELYVISTGLRMMVEGTKIGPHLNGIFASEYLENEQGVISEIARAVGHMKKTEFLYIVNKGANVEPEIDVNGRLPHEERRVPYEQMVGVFDGPTDVPVGATIRAQGGECLAVYNPNEPKAFHNAFLLREQNRVVNFSPADYTPGSQTAMTIEYLVRRAADKIVLRYEREKSGRRTQGPQRL